jgi:hypothetical protein
MTQLDYEAAAELYFTLQEATGALQEAERWRAGLADSVWYVSAPADSFAAVPYALKEWGPKAGFSWAVQRITVSGLGTSDVLTAYKARSTSEVKAQNALFTFTVAVAGAVASWTPGRAGLILLGRERGSLAFDGTISATITVNIDVIQVDDEHMALFLVA